MAYSGLDVNSFGPKRIETDVRPGPGGAPAGYIPTYSPNRAPWGSATWAIDSVSDTFIGGTIVVPPALSATSTYFCRSSTWAYTFTWACPLIEEPIPPFVPRPAPVSTIQYVKPSPEASWNDHPNSSS